MDSYNPALIFDLAAGNLPEAEARAAEASLSAEGRAELAAQRAVLAAIAAAPPVAMTDIERAHLHRSVAAAITETTRELRAVDVAAPAATPGRLRSVRWMRWASAAAVAAMFVGVVAVGSQLGSPFPTSGNDAGDAAETSMALAADLTSTTAAGAADGGDLPAGSLSERFGIASGSPEELADSISEEWALPVAPALIQARDQSDLAPLAGWLVQTRRRSQEPIEDFTSLPCYDVAVEDDDLDIADGFIVDYPGPDGQLLAGIGYADAGTDTVDPIIRIYDLNTCEPILASTD